MIDKLLKEMNSNIIIKESPYIYNGIYIPRVTHILSQMLYEDYLVKWANNIGIYQRSNYVDERDKAAYIGSLSHDNIEKYIKNKTYDIDSLNLDRKTYNKVHNAVESFIKWFDDVNKDNIINILGIEQKLVCPWFGGTYDMKIEINKKIYLTDFKTSNYISYKYFLQLAAYYYMLQTRNEHIDGFIILQLDKNNISYNEYVLLLEKPESNNFINLCINTFLSLVYAYYNRLNVQKEFDRLFRSK